jgi:predicted RNA binding protein YcfA (HicA-like mRNA interferase family)
LGKWDKLRAAVLSGQSDANIDFAKLCTWLQRIGFLERIVGSHHIFSNDAVVEIINLQPGEGGNAKPYQVKQVRDIVERYAL